MARGFALFAVVCNAVVGGATAKPHVVFILADDYGWANFGIHLRNGTVSKQTIAEVNTHNLDALVDEGVLLDRHYAYKICSPSRSSLQSGRLAVHVNKENTGVTVTNASDPVSGFAGIPRNMTGMAAKLRSAGYRTHMVGKWDAGMATPEHTPTGRGFETWVGYFQHANDYWNKGMPIQATGEVDNCLNKFTDLFMQNSTYRGGVRDGVTATLECLNEPQAHEKCYEEELFKERALSIVRNHDVSHSDSPLFLFYAFHLLHTPLQVPPKYLDRVDQLVLAAGGAKIDSQNRRLYAAMTLYMDTAVGELVEELKAKSMWQNTLLIFSSDNGGPVYEPGSANNHPLKGGKYSDWEGGVRVNAFMSGGFIPIEKRGSTFSGVMSIADWYGTVCELAGVDPVDHAAAEANHWLQQHGLPQLPPVDSVAQWGFFMNGTNGRPTLHLSEQALLQWPYKLVLGKQVYSFWQGASYPNCTTVEGTQAGRGPNFQDVKIFDVPVPVADTPEGQDKATLTQDCGSGCLFNVADDPTEHHDLSRDPAYAAKISAMGDKLHALNEGVFRPGRGAVNLAACERSVANGGYYGPFVDVEDWYSPVPPPSRKQRWRDMATKAEIDVLNHQIAQEGVVKAAKKIGPIWMKHFQKTVDKCVTESQPGDDITLVV